MSFNVHENEGVRRLMQQPNFNCDKYLKTVIKSGDSETSKIINLLTQWSDNTSTELKKAIYENADLFVDAGKAVGQLETSMHLINYDLREQKRVLNELCELRLISESSTVEQVCKEEMASNESGSILDQVEGMPVLSGQERTLLFSSELQELHCHNYSVVSPVTVILTPDLLLITKKYPHSQGQTTFRLMCSYELHNVAVVNVSERDCSSATNVFKIIAFPDTRVFRADSSRLKVAWMQHIENRLRQKHTGASHSMQESVRSSGSHLVVSADQLDSTDSFSFPDWLLELPDDLDVAIAERDFSSAVQLVEKAKANLATSASDTDDRVKADLMAKVEFRAAQLTEALSNELSAGTGRRGGIRSVHGAVSLLNRLGKRGLACELFLGHRSALMSQRASQVAREGSQALYAVRLSLVFHRGILEAVDDYQSVSHYFHSKLFCWCIAEARKFAEQLRILLVESRAVQFQSLCSIMGRVRLHARVVGERIGVNLEMALETGLIDCWEKAAIEHSKVLRDALDLRAIDEKWTPYVLPGQKNRESFVREMSEAGLGEVRAFVSGSNAGMGSFNVALTDSTCQFSRAMCIFTESLVRLDCRQLSVVAQDLLAGLLTAELRHYQRCLASNNIFLAERPFIIENLMFLSTTLIPKIETSLATLATAVSGSRLDQVTGDYRKCLNNCRAMDV